MQIKLFSTIRSNITTLQIYTPQRLPQLSLTVGRSEHSVTEIIKASVIKTVSFVVRAKWMARSPTTQFFCPQVYFSAWYSEALERERCRDLGVIHLQEE